MKYFQTGNDSLTMYDFITKEPANQLASEILCNSEQINFGKLCKENLEVNCVQNGVV